MKHNIATRAIEAGEKLTVRSALNPILWLCALVTIPALIVTPFINDPPVWLIFLICSPVVIALLGFVFLLIVDRDKLQSEDYQIKKRSLEIIEQKGDSAPMLIDPSNLNVIPKPEPVLITTGDDQ